VLAAQTASVAHGAGVVADAVFGEWQPEMPGGMKRHKGVNGVGVEGGARRAGACGRFDQRHLSRVAFMGPATRQGRLPHVRRRPGDRIDLSFDLESP
jgi:hypothetical protein